MKQFPESNSFLSRGENIFSDAKWFKDGRIFTRTAEAFYIWDVNGYLIRKVDKIAGDSIRGTAFLSDDRFVSWENGNENELYLWSSGGDKILEVKGFSGSVDEIIITPDDRIISTHYDSMLRIWDSSGNLLNTSKTPNPSLDEFTLTPTGQIITCGGNIIRIYNSDGEKLLDYTGHKKSALRARQRHDGSYVSWSYYEKAAHIWNSKGDLLNKIKLGYSLDEIRIREDDSMISWGEYSGHLDLWNADGSKQAGLKEHGRTIMRKVILLKDGMFLSIDRDSTICLWQNNNVLWENSEEDGWDKWVTDFQVTDDAVPLILSALDSGVIRFTA